mmetsp:Transcript_22565/g.64924  ORF Transcript_22565/g.64924 Transcript_22565/m.64924 type:complete len:150 (+) Transcript_22565:185-634(+)
MCGLACLDSEPLLLLPFIAKGINSFHICTDTLPGANGFRPSLEDAVGRSNLPLLKWEAQQTIDLLASPRYDRAIRRLLDHNQPARSRRGSADRINRFFNAWNVPERWRRMNSVNRRAGPLTEHFAAAVCEQPPAPSMTTTDPEQKAHRI